MSEPRPSPPTRTTSPRGARRRRGAAVVELGISLGLLMSLVFGAVDLGRFGYSLIVLTNAVRDGASVGSMRSFSPATRAQWEAEVRAAVVAEMESVADFDESKFTFDTPQVVPVPGGTSRLRVAASYPFSTLVDWPFVTQDITMRREIELPFIR